LHFEGVFGSVILNLEAENVVDSRKRLSILGAYPQLRPFWGILGFILNFALQPLHRLDARQRRGMDKRWNSKVAR
jgi:hypothetical protein